jgi:predicted heme/steroid binding protein
MKKNYLFFSMSLMVALFSMNTNTLADETSTTEQGNLTTEINESTEFVDSIESSTTTSEVLTTEDSIVESIISEDSTSSETESDTLFKNNIPSYTVENIQQQGFIKNNSAEYWNTLDELIEAKTQNDTQQKTVPLSDLTHSIYQITEKIVFSDQTAYYKLNDENEETIAYISEIAIKFVNAPQSVEQYFTLLSKETIIYQDINLTTQINTTNLLNKTFFVKDRVTSWNEKHYLVIFDNQNNKIGYLEESNHVLIDSPLGTPQPINTYVTVSNPDKIVYPDTGLKLARSQNSLLHVRFQAKNLYHHFDGKQYVSLENNENITIGYIDKTYTKNADTPQGEYQAYNKYVTIQSANYDIWQNFNWDKRSHSSNYQGQLLQARGYYDHSNGTRYLSLYDKAGKWIGYMDASGAKLSDNGGGGKYHAYNKYVTIQSPNYDIWQNFNWDKRSHSSKYTGKVLQARGYYEHFNGSRYLSLYDQAGKWVGYINASGTKLSDNGGGGKYHAYNKYVTIQSPNYDIWQNFNWDKRTHSSKYKGKTVLAKGYYDHFNGARYLSLYETNGHWIGYINETGTSLTKGAGSYLGINRSNILNELNNNSSMYLNTPFRGSLAIPASVMSPIGNPNQYGPGFNCTGFIATALRNSGANINKVANATSGIGGVANAYNWRDALTANTDYYTFYSVDALLQSGKAKKGDLIYFEADFTKPNYDCHIGFFWGDTPSQNRFWHSTLAAGGNKITHIFSGTPFSKILLIPMD